MKLELEDARAFGHELTDLADAITLPAFREGVDADVKADGTPVTAADHATEEALRAAIRDRHPGHAILGEEEGLVGDVDAPTWIIDPIDGTANYARGVPVWATLIALSVDDEPVMGVVSAPALGSRWDAITGGPARHNDATIRVSDASDLDAAHVSFGGLRYFDEPGWFDVIARLTERTARQRGFGDFWQHCLVAMGAVDVAIEAEVSRWDLAAVRVLVEAAGGRFSDLTGRATDSGGSALSTNGRLHDAVLDLVP